MDDFHMYDTGYDLTGLPLQISEFVPRDTMLKVDNIVIVHPYAFIQFQYPRDPLRALELILEDIVAKAHRKADKILTNLYLDGIEDRVAIADLDTSCQICN